MLFYYSQLQYENQVLFQGFSEYPQRNEEGGGRKLSQSQNLLNSALPYLKKTDP